MCATAVFTAKTIATTVLTVLTNPVATFTAVEIFANGYIQSTAITGDTAIFRFGG